MMKQTNAGECHRDSVFIASVNDIVIPDTSAGLCDIVYAALVSAFDIVSKGEEGI